jgi:hypothetical protein
VGVEMAVVCLQGTLPSDLAMTATDGVDAA